MTDQLDIPEPKILIEAEDDDTEITLGQFREKTKDLPDSTPLTLSVVVPPEYLDVEEGPKEEENTDSESGDDSENEEESEDEVVSAPIIGVAVESYADEDDLGADGKPKIKQAVALVMHLDDVLGDDEEDDEEDDEPVEPTA